MGEFEIRLKSVKDVQDFVGLATTMGFPVMVCDGNHCVDGGSFMEMFCLDCSHPLSVSARCNDEQLEAFKAAAQRFLV